MDAGDAWGRSSSSSSSSAAAARRLQSRYDLYMGFDEDDAAGVEEVEARGGEAYNCPFCGEDFDFVAFCCHVDDEHAVEAKSGVCPICATRVGADLIGHLTMQHGRSHSLLSLLRKDLRDGSLQSFLGGSSYVSNPPAAAPDPFLSSLICSLPVAEPSKDLHSVSSDNNFLLNKFPDEKTVERYVTSSFALSAASLRSPLPQYHCIWSVDNSFHVKTSKPSKDHCCQLVECIVT
uniref:Drought induced 19 protein type zinc-binding domain-containing protein n=1 Tax=Leersia perrieri TaxID=77586 RepID=A0A0D9WFJ4_9ORYZ